MEQQHFIPSNILKSIYHNAPLPAPVNINIQITNQCNLRCEFCMYHSFLSKIPWRSGHASASRLIHAIDELAQIGTKHITLCAKGEPSYHPKFFDIVKAIKRHPMSLAIYTNLSAKSPSAVDAYCKADRLVINLSAVNEKSYDAIYAPQVSGVFHQVLNNIMVIRKISSPNKTPYLEMCYIITNNNFRDISKAIELAASCGIQNIQFKNMYKSLHTDSLELNKAELKELHSIILDNIKHPTKVQTNLKVILQELFSAHQIRVPFNHCFIGWFYLSLDPNGAVNLCSHNKFANLGNWEKESIRDIWTRKLASNYRKLARDHFDNKKIFGDHCNFCPYANTNAQIEALQNFSYTEQN